MTDETCQIHSKKPLPARLRWRRARKRCNKTFANLDVYLGACMHGVDILFTASGSTRIGYSRLPGC